MMNIEFEEKLEYANRKEMKEEAIRRMIELEIWFEASNIFLLQNKVSYSDRGIIFLLTDEMQKRVDEYEKKTNCLVYHVIKSETSTGLKTWELLYVPDIKDDWKFDDIDIRNGMIHCYCINLNNEEFSECGGIGIMKYAGGLIRTF